MFLARGFTLTELLIAMTISSAFVVSAVSIALNHLKRQTVLHHQLALMEEVTLLKQAIATELRRAGFVNLSLTDYLLAPDAVGVFNKVKIDAYPGEAARSCILFSYDKNKNGKQDDKLPSELNGFRLKDKTIEYRMAGRHCRDAGWQDLSTPNKIAITSFYIEGPHAASYGAFYNISLSAKSVSAPMLKQHLRFTVNAANIPYE